MQKLTKNLSERSKGVIYVTKDNFFTRGEMYLRDGIRKRNMALNEQK